MRQALAAVLALALVLALGGQAVAKGRPEIVRLEPTVLDADFLAGTCGFPVELVDRSTNSKLMFFPLDGDGSQLVRSTGGYVSTLTNLESGTSATIRYYSKIDYDVQADGSQIVQASGSVLLFVYEGDDLSVFDPGLYLVTGSMHSRIGPDGLALEPERVRGKVVDLCAAVS